jgi:hypothetical protein
VVYYYMVQDFAPFTVGCFGPVASVDECRALYPTCNDGDEILIKTADGTRWYDRDCPCFHGEWMKSGWLGEQLRLQIADQPSHPDQASLVAYAGREFRTWGGAGPDWEGNETGLGEMCDDQVRYSPERWLGTWYYAEAVCRARGSSLMSSAKWVQGSPEAAADHLIYSQHGGHAEVWVGARQVWRHAHACDACQCKNPGDRCSFSHDNAVKNCSEGYEAHTTRVNGKMSMSRRASSGGGQPQA